ncbi:MAG: VWA domain-containing protein [Bryobacterales bacterium]|nr:VWA domain-containing protein [Bryobacterales bacterium]
MRIILDTSQSMRGTRTEPANDPSGHALISVALLHDLARYELGPDGTFKVMPFDESPVSKCAETVPRNIAVPWLAPAASTGRDAFVKRILDLTYDAPCTYFQPYLEASLKDLESTRRAPEVKRIVILITDGLSDARDEAKLLGELAPRLAAASVELYVLAFGRTATQNEAFFRPIFRFNELSGVTGALLADPTGAQLVQNMIRIFEFGFGYRSEEVAGSGLDLRAGTEQRHVAVVAVYDPPRMPAFSLQGPGGRSVNLKSYLSTALGRVIPKATPVGAGKPISYGVLWVNGPEAGVHQFRDSVPPRRIAVLRPRNLRVELARDAQDVAMVGAQMSLTVTVKPADGGSGDPGEVDLGFRVFAVRSGNEYRYTPSGDWLPAASPSKGVFRPGVGRVYEIRPEFQDAAAFSTPPQNGKWWDGYIEVRATSGHTTLALLDKGQHQVRIYPRLILHPDPPTATAMQGSSASIQAGADGCAQFRFRVEGTGLRSGDYNVSADLDEKLLVGPLRGARLRLNGIDIHQWANGRRIRGIKDRGLEVCITSPKHTAGGRNLKLPLRFNLWATDDDPYRRLDVVRPFTLDASLDPVSWQQRLKPLVPLLLLLLLLALLLAWLRYSLGFPPDFRTALAEGSVPGLPQPRALASPALWQALWSFQLPRPVSSIQGKLLGEVVPLLTDLYGFRPAGEFRQVTTARAKGEVLVPREQEGELLLAANEFYQVKGASGTAVQHIRLEFKPEEPKAGQR